MTLSLSYATALQALVYKEGSRDAVEIAEKFIGLLKQKGHITLLPGILSHFEDLAEEKEHEAKATVTIASESHEKKILRMLMERYDVKEGAVTVEIDDSLIGGYVYDNGNVVYDASYKRSLLNLYRALTA